jgi:hypothetical protein
MGFFDVVSGLGHGGLALLGIGQFYDPLAGLQKELADANAKTQSIYNNASLAFMQADNQEWVNLNDYLSTNNSTIRETMDYFNTLTFESIQKTNLFMIILSLLVLVVIFFILIQ